MLDEHDEQQEEPSPDDAEVEAEAPAEAEAEAPAEAEAEAPAEAEAEAPAEPEAEAPAAGGGADDDEEEEIKPEVEEYIQQDATVVHSEEGGHRTGPGIAAGLDPGNLADRDR